MKTCKKMYEILIPLKDLTINKIKKNLTQPRNKLSLIKSKIPEVNVYATFESTFSTLLGLRLQELAAQCNKNVINTDTTFGKITGIDLYTEFGVGQLKLSHNTQTGTHAKDSLTKLLNSANKIGESPFHAIALGRSFEYKKDDILYLGGSSFWTKISIDYNILYNTLTEVISEIYEDIECNIIPTLWR